MKPHKWSGFQMGNHFVAELLALHAAPGCSLILVRDDLAFEAPWNEDESAADWREDLRSRTLWESYRHARKPPEMVCATCEASLDLPAIPDVDELRRAGARPGPGAIMPLIVGLYLWFCGPTCRDAFQAVPGRTWRSCPELPPGSRLRVGCRRCNDEAPFDSRSPEPSDAVTFAEWLIDHVHRPPEDCRLEVYVAPVVE